MIPEPYTIDDPSGLNTPTLVVYPELIRRNIAELLRIAGGPARLRPHVKTHKTREIVHMLLAAGVTRHKCATIAEAEILADCGAAEILIAYPLVGPNPARLATLAARFPKTRFAAAIDHAIHAEGLSAAFASAGVACEIFLDLNVGMDRTGIRAGPAAAELYRHAVKRPGLRPGGLHVYDGQNHQESSAVREQAVQDLLAEIVAFRDSLERSGLPMPRIICGGTPTFPAFAKLALPGLELSPGTLVLHDHSYAKKFADLAGFTPAAVVLTRVISRPTPSRVTFDAGNKALAADPPLARRGFLPAAPEAVIVGHNEEHLIIETPNAADFAPGDVTVVLPGHVCPTVAWHKRMIVVERSQAIATWEVAARDRELSV